METRPCGSFTNISPRHLRDSEQIHFPGRSLVAFEEAFQNVASSPWHCCLCWPVIAVIFFNCGISAFRNFSLFQSHGFRFVLQAGDCCQILLLIIYCWRQDLFPARCWRPVCWRFPLPLLVFPSGIAGQLATPPDTHLVALL